MERVVLASDFHLDPGRPDEIGVFVEFTRQVVAGADRFYVLGDLFNVWVGRTNLRVAGLAPALDALEELAREGTEVVLLHGNRDFLLGRAEAARVAGRVAGEEIALEAFGKRYLLLHGDSLCTRDVGYQRSKVVLRSPPVRLLARLLPFALTRRVAGGLRRASRRSTAAKPREVMELVPQAVRRRLAEGWDALICGHVHAPGVRDYGEDGRPAAVYVLGDWHGGGVYGIVDAGGVRLVRYDPPAGSREGAN